MALPPELADAPLVDPLSVLPDPRSDLHALRTFPGLPSRGRIDWERDPDGTVRFVTRLPRRWGGIGATRRGLFGLGGWYPQPMAGGGLPQVRWDVRVSLPEGAGGALGDVADTGELAWTGLGERAGLAVVPRPVFTPLEAGPSDVLLVSRGRPRRSLVNQLARALAGADPPLDGVVAVAPLRRRLTGHAPGLALISDRAFRLTPGFRFVHRVPAVRGVAEALVPQPDPLDRELAAAAIARAYDQRRRSLDASRLLRTFSWVPQVNAILASERMPFYSEVLGRTWPADPVHDELTEVLDPHAPGTAVLAQLDDQFGDGTGVAVGLALAAGDGAAEALAASDVDREWIAPWRREVPPQDYVLAVADGQVTVGRLAPDDAPPETLIVRANGVDHAVQLDPGYHPMSLPGPVRRVALDPAGHVRQTSRRGDSWPPRYDWTASAWLASIDLRQGIVYAGAWVTLRRQYDTRNLWVVEASNNRANLVSAQVVYLRKEGRLLDAFARPHRIRMEVGASLLDPSFADTQGLLVGLDGALGWALDNRVSSDFPLRGRRIGLTFTGGGIPGSATTWIGASGSAVQLASFHPRWAVAAIGSGSVAGSDLPHRLLSLGGPAALRSVPTLPACADEAAAIEPCLPVADARAVASTELRFAAIRGASVPMLLAWGTELQLTVGAEAMVAHVPGGASGAVDEPVAWGAGITAGALGLGDVLGTQSSGLGFTAAWRVAGGGAGIGALPPIGWIPEVYVRFSQAF
jgi:hypothetical protein